VLNLLAHLLGSFLYHPSFGCQYGRAAVAVDAAAADAAPYGEEMQVAVGLRRKRNELWWSF